jgi:hypothetical protein
LAQADQRRHELTTDTAGRVGAMLLAENRRSVDHRYDEQKLAEPYLFTRLTGTPDPVVVLKVINCHEYQSRQYQAGGPAERTRYAGHCPP